jgi:hypothetical protein
MQAALISGRDPEQGIPFSWTQPGGMGGQGVPSGRTQDCSGPAYALGIAAVNAVPNARMAAPQIKWR